MVLFCEVDQAVPVDLGHVRDRWLFHHEIAGLASHCVGPVEAGRVGQEVRDEDVTLIFLWHEGSRDNLEQPHRPRDDQRERDEPDDPAPRDPFHAAHVAIRDARRTCRRTT